MRRPVFIMLIDDTTGWTLAAHAQPAGKLPVIGLLLPGTATSHGPWFAAMVQRLRELGWIEGRTVALEYRYGEGGQRALR
jgi:putative tryptophan/tyrosine transport system substrate-binding protein